MNIIAMIPARLSSKRIPQKNIRYMGDKPLIQYPIDLAVSSGLFQSVWVTTESSGLQPFVEKCGAQFHQRPAELSTDTATNSNFTYEFMQKHMCDFIVMVNTTSPLLRAATLQSFVAKVETNAYDTVMSVVAEQAESFYKGEPLNFSLQKKVNSQQLEPVEKIVWALTAWRRETFLQLCDEGKEPVFGGKLGRFAIPKDEACDLDTPEDWRIAEGILQARKLQENAADIQYLPL